MGEIAATAQVEHLEQAGFVVRKNPATAEGAALGRGFEG
jgi:hypothetical protein